MSDYYKKSDSWRALALAVTPGGAQTLSKAPSRFPAGAYPFALKEGYDASVWDVDGHEYIDWIAGLGAITLGYCNETVENAVLRQLMDGVTFSLQTVVEIELAERLTTVIPCAEMVRFVKTGSEATEAAIRVARMATGRDLILTVRGGYHGWHSWFTATRDEHRGVPDEYESMVFSFPYNDLERLRWHLIVWEQTAAVILEPCLYEPPNPGFLQGVVDVAHKHGALVIFDEMVTGYRWALAGGQEFFQVTPDLACFGKGMANGLPLACLVGRKELMQHATVVSGTFGGEALSLAAGMAVLDVYQQEAVVDRLWATGRALMSGFNQAAKDAGIDVLLDGYPVRPRLTFKNDPEHRRLSVFLQETAKRGILIHPSGFCPMAAHTDQDVRKTIEACADALRQVADGAELDGDLCQPNPFRPIPT